jgi:thioredoxin reductase (NADPH)
MSKGSLIQVKGSSETEGTGQAEGGEGSVENVVICGSGPAGLTAALYSARANLGPLVLQGMQPGGQLTTTTEVENFPGFEHGIMGPELMEVMQKQVSRFGARLEMDEVERCELDRWPFVLHTAQGRRIETKTLVIATGATAKYLGLPSETRLRGHGVSACATCDGFFFRGVEIAVVGGGDSACEEASFLTRFASRVHLIVRRDNLRASKIMQRRVMENPKITIHWNAEVAEVLGAKEVSGLKVRNLLNGEVAEWAQIKGLFLAIGHEPNSAPFRPWLAHDEVGYLKVHAGTSKTDIPGVFICGDVQDRHYRQAVTAAGSGCMAAIDAERWLEARESGDA